MPVTQLQNVINDASAEGNKTYSSNKIETMNTNLNDRINLLNLKQIYANYIVISFDNYLGLIFCTLMTPFKISTLDDFYTYLSQTETFISASGQCGTIDNEYASIYALKGGLLTNREISVRYIDKNGKDGLSNIPINRVTRFSSVSKELL